MTMHVFVPFGRPQNLREFVDHMRTQNIILHPVFESNRHFDFPNEPWIRPYLASPVHKFIGPGCQPPELLNEFIDKGPIEDEAHYHLFSDDCFVEPGYYQRIAGGTKDILVTSTKRGHHLVASTAYDNTTLYGRPENMRMGQMAGEQLHIRGRVLKQARAAGQMVDHRAWDGFLMDRFLVPKCRDQCQFFPDVFSWFNYLEPGRWDR